MSHISTIQWWRAGRGNWGRWFLKPFLIQRSSSPCVSLEICLRFHSPAGNKEEHDIYHLIFPWLCPMTAKVSGQRPFLYPLQKGNVCWGLLHHQRVLFPHSHSFSSSLSTAFPASYKHFKTCLSFRHQVHSNASIGRSYHQQEVSNPAPDGWESLAAPNSGGGRGVTAWHGYEEIFFCSAAHLSHHLQSC